MSDTARSSRYEIRVEVILDPRWRPEGLAIGSDDSQTVISGPVRTRRPARAAERGTAWS